MKANKAISGPKADPTLFPKVSQLVATSESLDDILQYIIEEAVLVCDASRGFLAIADHERGDLDVRYTAGISWTEEVRLGRLKVAEGTGRGITSHVAATGKPYRSADVLKDPYYRMYFDDVRSEVAVPLVDKHSRTRGVINIESTRLDAFDERHEATVLGLANLAAIAITVDELRARESALIQIGKELNGLSDMAAILQKVIEVAAEALKFEDCSLFLYDRASSKLILRASRGPLGKKIGDASYDVGEGLTGWTAEQQQPIRVQNPKKDPRWRGRFEELPSKEVGAFMAVPINSHSGILGVLRVQRKKSPYKWFPNDFTEDDERALSTISVQLGIALDNARLLDQLVKTERMAAWGEMSARSAHMIGNRVFAIKGDVNELEYILQQASIDAGASLKLSESIKKGIFLLEEILNEFREFVKATQLDLEEVDLNVLVTEAIEEGFPKRSQTKLKKKLAQGLPIVMADPKKLIRCFTELMENSVNFMPDGGEIKITTGFADAKSKKWLRPNKQSGNYVQITFEDKGPGVETDQKPKIFDPFYTSRAKGMGLGLSIVKGIVDAHDGVIFENGKPGKGAKFSILIPYES
ncbi:MAG: GAF domain-containing protein [Armatimonadota bacterium]